MKTCRFCSEPIEQLAIVNPGDSVMWVSGESGELCPSNDEGCDECEGAGLVECTECDDDTMDECDYCGQSGDVECEECNGTGENHGSHEPEGDER